MKQNMFISNAWKTCFGILSGIIFLTLYATIGCSKYPTDNDGLLITTRGQCYVSNFILQDAAFQNVAVAVPSGLNPTVDTVACTIGVIVRYGTDVKNLYPQFSLITDAKLDPAVTGLTDFSSPRQWTVIAGNRKVRKTYTVTVTVQQP
jgi:hypothetical protein